MDPRKIFILMFMTLFMVSFVAAFEFDNVKDYDAVKREAEFYNSFLGIKTTQIGVARLNSNPVERVAPGYSLIGEFDLWASQDYEFPIKDILFYNKSFKDWKNYEINKKYDLKIKTVEKVSVIDYDDVAIGRMKNGTVITEVQAVGRHVEYKDVWHDFDNTRIFKGNKYTIGVFTHVDLNERGEWIPVVYGVEVDEWAEWIGDLNTSLRSYYKLDNNDLSDNFGNSTFDLTNSGTSNNTGFIINGRSFDGTNDDMTGSYNKLTGTTPRTFNVWINSTDTANYRDILTYGTESQAEFWHWRQNNNGKLWIQIQGPATPNNIESNATLSSNTWHMATITYDGTTTRLYQDAVLVGEDNLIATTTGTANGMHWGSYLGASEFWQGQMDEIGVWTRALNQSEIILIYHSGNGLPLGFNNGSAPDNPPTISFNSPASQNFTYAPVTLSFNFTAYDDVNLTDVKLFINGVLNQTNASGINDTDYIFNLTLGDGTYSAFGRATDNNSQSTDTGTENYVIDSIVPEINISSPVSTYEYLTNLSVLDLNYSIFDVNNDSCMFTYALIPELQFNDTTQNITYSSPGTTKGWIYIDDTTNQVWQSQITLPASTSLTIRIARESGQAYIQGANSSQYQQIEEPDNGNTTLNMTDGGWHYFEITGSPFGGNHPSVDLFRLANPIGYARNNTALNCTTNTTFLYQEDTNDLTLFVNDKLGNFHNETVSWNYYFFETSFSHPTSTSEGATEPFNLFGKTGLSAISSAALIYNGTSYSATVNYTTGSISILRNLVIPDVNSTTNATFYWSIRFADATIANSSTFNVTVSSIDIDNCSAYTTRLFNYTLVDEGNQSLLNGNVTTDIELDLEILSFDRSASILNYSRLYENINPALVCININVSNQYKLDSIVRYQGLGYANEYYNIVNFTLSNTSLSQNITLYDLASDDNTDFQLTFTDGSFIPVENALVYVDRQYIAENSFKTVELPKTDANGQTVLHLVRNDVIYNLRMIKDGQLIGNFQNIIAFCDDVTIGDCKISLSSTDQATVDDYGETLGIVFDSAPTYDNSTNEISFTYSSVDGSAKTVLLEVERQDAFGNRTICNEQITSTSGTVSCNIGTSNSTDVDLIAVVSVGGVVVSQNSIAIDNFTYGNMGYIAWFVLTLVLVIASRKSKNLQLASLIVSYLGAVALAITRAGAIGLGSAGVWILIVTLAAIFTLNKGRTE